MVELKDMGKIFWDKKWKSQPFSVDFSTLALHGLSNSNNGLVKIYHREDNVVKCFLKNYFER